MAEDSTTTKVYWAFGKARVALAFGYSASLLADEATNGMCPSRPKTFATVAMDIARGMVGYTAATVLQVSKAAYNAHKSGEVRTANQVKKDASAGQNMRLGRAGMEVTPQQAVALAGGLVISVTKSEQKEQEKFKDITDKNTHLFNEQGDKL
ncbi:hypothetical protein ACHAQK_012310 [Fusarium lateritium]